MQKMDSIYLDYAASTPVSEEVIKAMVPYLSTHYGNPSNTTHPFGQMALEAVKKAETQIKSLLNGEDYQVVFTSGATESLNTCLKGLFTLHGHKKKRIITCPTEHKAVLSVCEHLKTLGAEIIYLPVNTSGQFSLPDLEEAINEQTLAVALMAVNNETGIIHDFKAISSLCQSKKVPFVCDATQAIGKIPVDLKKTPATFVACSGHKFYAPKGVGALLIKNGTTCPSLIHGGGQQNNLRAGTLNVPGIVAIGKAAEQVGDHLTDDYNRISQLKNYFENQLKEITPIAIVAEAANRSPYVSNICFTQNQLERLLLPLQARLAFSTASACDTKAISPSYVLKAMGLSNQEAANCIRFSFGHQTTKEELDLTLKLIEDILKKNS